MSSDINAIYCNGIPSNQHLWPHAEHTPEYLITYDHVLLEMMRAKLGRGIRVRSQSKEATYNVHKYFERLNKKGGPRHQ